jgi:hypothetical protein
MGIVERVKAVLLRPKETFELIKTESATTQDLILNYLAILAVIPNLKLRNPFSFFPSSGFNNLT